MAKLTSLVKSFMREEEGATMIEYALLGALISVMAMVSIDVVGDFVNDGFKEIVHVFKKHHLHR